MSYHGRTLIYKAGLTKQWNGKKGTASLFYKYSQSETRPTITVPSTMPGTVKSGKCQDSYMPEAGKFQYNV